MIQEFNYISIKEIVQRIKRHPYLADISFEKVVQYVLDFFRLVGLPKMFQDKIDVVDINDFKGILPCDLVQINQVREHKTKTCLRSMTDNFNVPVKINNHHHHYHLPYPIDCGEFSFKTSGNIIFVSFRKGKVEISYKAMPVDDDGFPLILDNPVFLKALELYIQNEEFHILFDLSQIPQVVLQEKKQQYALAVAELGSELTLPSVSEMESIGRMWNTLIQRTTDFDNGFKNLSNREYLRVQP